MQDDMRHDLEAKHTDVTKKDLFEKLVPNISTKENIGSGLYRTTIVKHQ